MLAVACVILAVVAVRLDSLQAVAELPRTTLPIRGPRGIEESHEMRRTTWVDDKGLSHEVVTRADEVGERQTLEGLHSERVNKAIAQWPPKAAGDVDEK